MLRLKTNDNNFVINTPFFSEQHSSDRQFYNQKLLNLGTNLVIDDVVDAEVMEFKPIYSEVNFNLFFFRYIVNSELQQIGGFIEDQFTDHVKKTKDIILNSKVSKVPFEVKQEDGFLAPELRGDAQFTRVQQIKNNPYPISDPLGASSIKKPKQAGLPIFYNTFTLPFWDEKETWFNDDLLYTNKAFFYNSFLLMEFFDSTNNQTQNRLFSIPIFINPRYNSYERVDNNNLLTERPVYRLKSGDEGYSFLFLRKYITNEFYVKFSFWDSLNNRKISLLPSSSTTNDNRKWVQDLNTFNQDSRYIKYTVDYTNGNYKMLEYDYSNNLYTNEKNSFDFYELIFDDYWVNTPVVNTKPINAKSLIQQPQVLDNPFKFNINNIDVTLNKPPINTLVELPYTTISSALDSIVSDFQFENISDQPHTINRVLFENMSIQTVYPNKETLFYRSYSDGWDVVNKNKSCEVSVVPGKYIALVEKTVVIDSGLDGSPIFGPIYVDDITDFPFNDTEIVTRIDESTVRNSLINVSAVLNMGNNYTLSRGKKVNVNIYLIYGRSTFFKEQSPIKVTGQLKIVTTNEITKERKNIIVPIRIIYNII